MVDSREPQSSTVSQENETDDLSIAIGREVFCYGCGGVDGRTTSGGLLCHDCKEKEGPGA